ncbi:MAG: hypothetical protein AAGC84_18045 [Pseudomonas sp.]
MRWPLSVIAVACAAAVGFYLWAKAEYYPIEAVDRAQAFITLLEAGQLDKAQALALRNEYVGRTPAEFAVLTQRQLCTVDRVEWTAPPQTNGNRLRRWWRDEPLDMPEVHVEFQGSCLLKVTLRAGEDGQWRVFNLQRHAG